ncbi:alpha/beta hydrolase [Pseudohoeflea suaedae]|uniref:Alpha/beta hydrolase n=1 Tax=Pseudohoeflea suaedae TaxID=877384 RepID=A0A4R5PIT5_9HYPH|nr:alpha/beta hydrolase [Pseudohoeflea suaedae]TDH35071.1 alpha/beta hydrolase [Pseudohoeflea suaedae]
MEPATKDQPADDAKEAAPTLHATPDNPVPENHVVGYFETRDKRRLRYAVFKSETRIAKGTIVLLHGRNEYIEKYFETIRHFTGLGFWVATFDWRGQGGSDRLLKRPLRGHVNRFSDFEDDLSIFLETIVLPETRLPFLMVAHSMGGLIALSAAPTLANRIDRLICLAPFLELSNQRVGVGVIHFMCRMLTILGLGWVTFERDAFPRPFEGNVLTSDAARFRRNQKIYEAWPDLRVGPPTARWIAAMLSAIRTVGRVRHLDRIQVPTLLIAAGADTIVSQRAIETVANRFRAGHMLTIDGARHELLQEADRYRIQTLAAIDAFLLPDEEPPLERLLRRASDEAETEIGRETVSAGG